VVSRGRRHRDFFHGDVHCLEFRRRTAGPKRRATSIQSAIEAAAAARGVSVGTAKSPAGDASADARPLMTFDVLCNAAGSAANFSVFSSPNRIGGELSRRADQVFA
jgi:hypothetical protein